MQIGLIIAHVTISVLLMILILLQAKGQGLSSAFGGGGEIYHTRRGAEQIIFTSTIALATLFVITSALQVIFF